MRMWARMAAGAALAMAAAPAFAQGARCTLDDLQGIADAYIAAQTAGDAGKLPLADFTQYTEQGENASLFSGLLGTAHAIDFHRTFLDLASCASFVEAVIADPKHPYVVGTRLQFSGRENPIAPSRVNEIESVVTDQGDWQFDAAAALKAVKAENWGTIPEGQRDSRATLIAAANAYLDRLGTPGVAVPFGSPCSALEGGRYTAERCDAQLPSTVKAADRHPVIDETTGTVAVVSALGPNKRAAVHLFRIEGGKIRYVHAMAVCDGADCGLPPRGG